MSSWGWPRKLQAAVAGVAAAAERQVAALSPYLVRRAAANQLPVCCVYEDAHASGTAERHNKRGGFCAAGLDAAAACSLTELQTR